MDQRASSRLLWIALVAVGLLLRGLVMPVSMPLTGTPAGSLLVEVCSASGKVQQVIVAVPGSGKKQGSDSPHGKHCPWCNLQHDNVLPFAASPQLPRLTSPVAREFAWREAPTRPALAWVSLPSRAPPSI